MNTWVYRILMTLLIANIGIGVYALANQKPPQEMCINGILMQPHGDMWQQKGMWPTHCINVDKD